MSVRSMVRAALFMAFLSAPIAAFADCGSDCTNRCNHLGSGPAWANCMETCMKRCLGMRQNSISDKRWQFSQAMQECPTGSGKYCPVGTYCALKEDGSYTCRRR